MGRDTKEKNYQQVHPLEMMKHLEEKILSKKERNLNGKNALHYVHILLLLFYLLFLKSSFYFTYFFLLAESVVSSKTFKQVSRFLRKSVGTIERQIPLRELNSLKKSTAKACLKGKENRILVSELAPIRKACIYLVCFLILFCLYF